MALTRRRNRADTIGSLGDMQYLASSGLYVPVGLTKATGKVPTIQSDGTIGWQTPSGGGGGGAAITLRGSSSAFSGAASFTVALPAGSVAGDTAFLFVSSGNAINSPTTAGTDWTPIDYGMAASGVTYATFRKVLSSTDISNGNVTINTSAFACAAALVVYQGAPVNVSHDDLMHFTSNIATTNKPWRTKATLVAGDDLLIVMTTRSGINATSSIGTLLQNVNNTISMAVYRYPIPASDFVDATLNMSAIGFEAWVTRMAVRGY